MTQSRSVGELFDRADMMDVLHAYCRAADANSTDGMLAQFSDDCSINYFGGDESRAIAGKPAFRELLGPLLGKVISGAHYITNTEFAFRSPDEAIVHAYMQSWQRFSTDQSLPDKNRWGRYELLFRRNSEGWRIRDLRLFVAGERGGDRMGEYLNRPWPVSFPA